MRVASRVAKRLKTCQARKYQKNFKISYNYSLVLSPLSKIKILLTQAQNSLKMEIERFPQCAISHKN